MPRVQGVPGFVDATVTHKAFPAVTLRHLLTTWNPPVPLQSTLLGLDTCVCVAVALLLACYSAPGAVSSSATSAAAGGADGAAAAPAGDAADSGLAWTRSYNPGQGVSEVTKDSVRQRLAWLSAHYPAARPTRGMLRQVCVGMGGGRGRGRDGCGHRTRGCNGTRTELVRHGRAGGQACAGSTGACAVVARDQLMPCAGCALNGAQLLCC